VPKPSREQLAGNAMAINKFSRKENPTIISSNDLETVAAKMFQSLYFLLEDWFVIVDGVC
jgi:hypothetical protein